MKILVPIDGSKASVNAATKAVEIVKRENASIKFLTVINDDFDYSLDNIVMSQGYINTYSRQLMEVLREQGVKLLDGLMDTLDIGGLKAEKQVFPGIPYESILTVAENDEVDLIVMGNRGFSQIKRFFLGSVAQKVIAEAPCPVLVIHTDADEE
jgi:nucleotide-binding universal stress UspA family protein